MPVGFITHCTCALGYTILLLKLHASTDRKRNVVFHDLFNQQSFHSWSVPWTICPVGNKQQCSAGSKSALLNQYTNLTLEFPTFFLNSKTFTQAPSCITHFTSALEPFPPRPGAELCRRQLRLIDLKDNISKMKNEGLQK